MKYEIEVVGNDELPDGVDRVIAERASGEPPLLILTEDAAQTWAFLQRWEDEHREPAQVIELRHVV